jgi:PAS domain S-box-containing protein
MDSLPPFLSPLIAGVLSSATAVFSLRADRRLARWLFLLSASVAWWSFGYTAELLSRDLATAMFWTRVEYFGIVVAPVAWLCLAWVYAGLASLRAPRLLLLFSLPAATVVCVWWLPQLIWSEPRLVDIGGQLLFRPDHGPWYWVHTAYSYGAMAAGTVLVVVASLRASGFYRRRLALLLAAALAPWIANATHVFGRTRIDWTCLAFALSALLYLWGLGSLRLLATRPVAASTLLEHLGDGTLVVDSRGKVLEANAAMRPLLAGDPVAAIGAPLAACAPALAAALRGHLDVAAPQGRSTISLTAGERERVFDVASFPLPTHGEQVASRLLALRDVTARERAEQDLRQTNARFDTLFDHLHAGVLIETGEGAIWRVNRSFCALFRIDADPASLRATDAALLHARCSESFEDAEAFLEGIRRVVARGNPVSEEQVNLRDGRTFEREFAPVPGFGATPGRLWIFRDVTVSRRIESLLRLAEAQSRALLDNVPGIVWRADAYTFRISEVSAGAEAMLGYSRARWLAEPFLWLDLVHADDRARLTEGRRAAVATGRDLDLEYRMARADGRTIWVHETARVVLESGLPVALVGVLVDVSAQRAGGTGTAGGSGAR